MESERLVTLMLCLSVGAYGSALFGEGAGDVVTRVAAEIRTEVTRPNFGEQGWPLPLASHWTTDGPVPADGYEAPYQTKLLEPTMTGKD